jgi:hypothetical protein
VRVFISSVISGMEEFRAAARQAAETLGHTVTAAEDFRASPHTPQQVCLGAVRDADVVLLLLGPRYGIPQNSGLSPTHEEYREARGAKAVLAFVQQGVTREPQEEVFLQEVSTWEGGGYREAYDTPAALGAAVTRALHNWELSQQAGPVNEEELASRAAALLPTRSAHAAGVAPLHVVVAGAPTQRVLRPGDLDDEALRRDMQREAVYGDRPVFDPELGVHQPVVHETTLVVAQTNAQITLDEHGNVRVSRPAREVGRRTAMGGLACLIEEDVRERIADSIRYAGWLLDRVDPVHRLSRVALACRLAGVGYLPWRTRAEVAASPNAASMGTGAEAADSPPVVMARAGLLFDVTKLADDITVRLRRQLK